jgi:uncharacterized Zn finger protein
MNQLVWKCKNCGYCSVMDIPDNSRAFEVHVGDIFLSTCKNCKEDETKQLVQFMTDEIIIEECL